jgi:hypothetical protein
MIENLKPKDDQVAETEVDAEVLVVETEADEVVVLVVDQDLVVV